jgi:type 1 fimbria pilin
VLQATVSTAEYCWVQIKGAATLSIALAGGADGAPLTPTGAADGTLDVSALVTDNVCAIAGDLSDFEIICDFPW